MIRNRRRLLLLGIMILAFVGGVAAAPVVTTTTTTTTTTTITNTTVFKTFFATFTTDSLGQIFLTGIMDVRGFEKVSVEIVQFPTSVPNFVVNIYMGKISGSTLSMTNRLFSLRDNR